MNIYIFAIAGFIVGAILGWIAPFHIPISYANYTSVAVLAALDAVFGGSRAALERIFDLSNFVTWVLFKCCVSCYSCICRRPNRY